MAIESVGRNRSIYLIVNGVKVIALLSSHDARSVEFYDIATAYFRRRFRRIRNCGIFFIALATLNVALVIIHWRTWPLNFISFLSAGVCGPVGRGVFLLGKHNIKMIITARRAGEKHRLNALRQITSGPFRTDPVSLFVKQHLAGDF